MQALAGARAPHVQAPEGLPRLTVGLPRLTVALMHLPVALLHLPVALVRLTVALVRLTVGLLCLTVGLLSCAVQAQVQSLRSHRTEVLRLVLQRLERAVQGREPAPRAREGP